MVTGMKRVQKELMCVQSHRWPLKPSLLHSRSLRCSKKLKQMQDIEPPDDEELHWQWTWRINPKQMAGLTRFKNPGDYNRNLWRTALGSTLNIQTLYTVWEWQKAQVKVIKTIRQEGRKTKKRANKPQEPTTKIKQEINNNHKPWNKETMKHAKHEVIQRGTCK